jgi:N-acetylmuramoyl-L-alanine amidase
VVPGALGTLAPLPGVLDGPEFDSDPGAAPADGLIAEGDVVEPRGLTVPAPPPPAPAEPPPMLLPPAEPAPPPPAPPAPPPVCAWANPAPAISADASATVLKRVLNVMAVPPRLSRTTFPARGRSAIARHRPVWHGSVMSSTFPADSALVADVHPSPSHDERSGDVELDILLLHYTGMISADAALERLCAPDSRVSCHYLVHEDGRVVQMVAEARRAWHAGLSNWEGETDTNSRSVGIEIVNPGHEHGYRPFPDAQIEAVIALGLDICARHGIARQRVLAHSDVAPRRKEDPGELFPWDRLHAAGLGHWQKPAPLTTTGDTLQPGDDGEVVETVQSLFAIYGYGVEISGVVDAGTVAAATAFQRHFRQEKVDGVIDPSTIATLRRLLKALPKS